MEILSELNLLFEEIRYELSAWLMDFDQVLTSSFRSSRYTGSSENRNHLKPWSTSTTILQADYVK